MSISKISPIDALVLFFAMLLLVELGRRLRKRNASLPDIPGTSAMESAIFALFGLLLAFTFSGAMSRYDAHRQLIVQETNNIGTAWLRLDLLPATAQPALRQSFREYTAVRARRFDAASLTSGASIAGSETVRLQNEIWTHSVAAASGAGASPDAAKLLLPALNDMIDITSTRKNAFNMHPPAVITLLLVALACTCSLMAGFGMSGSQRSWLHMIAFAAAISLTIYATLDIEYPREGLVTLTSRDQVFLDLLQSMN
jgi:hypothetical protein